MGRSWPLLDRSWAALECSWAPLEGLLANLGGLLTTIYDPSWSKLGSEMPSEAILIQKHELSKSIGKRKEKHICLIRRWLRNAAKRPQDHSKPLLADLENVLGALGTFLSTLGPLLLQAKPQSSNSFTLVRRAFTLSDTLHTWTSAIQQSRHAMASTGNAIGTA